MNHKLQSQDELLSAGVGPKSKQQLLCIGCGLCIDMCTYMYSHCTVTVESVIAESNIKPVTAGVGCDMHWGGASTIDSPQQ